MNKAMNKFEIRISVNDPIDVLTLYNEFNRLEIDDIRVDADQCIIQVYTARGKEAVQQQIEMFIISSLPIGLRASVSVYE